METSGSKSREKERWHGLWWVVGLLAAYRLAYHAVYVGQTPFAWATFSDGAVYEASARDLLAAPPLGTKPFYLQGLYAYTLASGIAWTGEVLSGLCVQLVLAVATWAFAARALVVAFGPRVGALSTAALLAYFPLAFYENKYLSASLGVATNVLVWLAFASFTAKATSARASLVGIASGLSVLGRPNMVLALPFTLFALFLRAERNQRAPTFAAFVVGTLLALAPMAARNGLVTGSASVFPAHGGGTSFYIGNNPSADGRWNTAGGLITGQVGLERRELLEKLGLPERSEREDAAAIGRALYERAFAFIGEDPGAWLKLELRKLWLTLGNDELTQDYDVLGERELVPSWLMLGVPFGLLAALGLLGAWALFRAREPGVQGRAWLSLLGGQALVVLVTNLVYFTSSQHRLPLAVALAALSGPGLAALLQRARERAWFSARALGPVALASLLLAQAWVPRETRARVSLAHLYNLSVVSEVSGDLTGAERALSRALERRPDHPVFRLEHASLLRRLGRFDEAQRTLAQLAALPGAPGWVTKRAKLELRLAAARRTDALGAPASR